MKEIIELRINMNYAHLLFRKDEGKNLGDTVKIVRFNSNDPILETVKNIDNILGEEQK